MFGDITTLLKDPQGFSKVFQILEDRYKNKNIDLLKLRASYGRAGQSSTGAGRYPYQGTSLVELVIALVIRKAISEVTTRAKQAIVTINGKYPIC